MRNVVRQRLFWLAAVIFICITGLALAHSFGYRITEDGIVVRTGGLFIASSPALDTEIYVNNERIKKTSLISRSTFLQSLTPGEYTIRVERERYHTWTKTIAVAPELVTEIHALLVPDPAKTEILANGDFQTIAPWSTETLKITSHSGRHRYFDTVNSVFAPTQITPASSTPEILPELLTEHLATIDADRIRVHQDHERFIWQLGKSVFVEWLPDATLPLYAKGGDRVYQIYRDNRPIRDIWFYPRREAAIVVTRNDVLVVELDPRGGNNSTPLYKGKHPVVAIPDPNRRELFILDEGTLFKVDL